MEEEEEEEEEEKKKKKNMMIMMMMIMINPNHFIPSQPPRQFYLSVLTIFNAYCTKTPHMNFKLKFLVKHTTIILTNSCNTRSRKLKTLSVVQSTYSKISLKMALLLGRNM